MPALVIDALEYVGGTTLLIWQVLKLIFRGRVHFPLLLQQMVLLGVNSIPISMMVIGFAGSVFTYILAVELYDKGVPSMTGGLLMLILLRETIPVFTSIVLAGKIGASITSEIATMKLGEQLDALRALSTDVDWYLTGPRVIAGILMMPIIAVFAGYAGWFAGYYTAYSRVNMNYSTFTSQVRVVVDEKDYYMCIIKCLIFGALVVLTACYYGFRATGGASGVGRVVTTSVVVNIFLIFVFDLIITALMT